MPLLEPSDLRRGQTVDAGDSTLLNLNAVLLRVARALLFRLDEHSLLDELPISQIRCLNAIGNEEGRKMQEVAASIAIKLPAMSQIVERLVRRGLVERRADPTDRRVARLHLTASARELIESARAARLEHLRGAAQELGPEKTERLLEDLLLLADAGERMQEDETAEEIVSENAGQPLDGPDPLIEMLALRARGVRRASGEDPEGASPQAEAGDPAPP